MIKVIKKGRYVKKFQYKQECVECGCVFESDYEDIKAEDYPCSQPYLSCPTCNNRVLARLNSKWLI